MGRLALRICFEQSAVSRVFGGQASPGYPINSAGLQAVMLQHDPWIDVHAHC